MDNYSCIKLQQRDLQLRFGTQTRDVVAVREASGTYFFSYRFLFFVPFNIRMNLYDIWQRRLDVILLNTVVESFS
jgi:hypothetical protein